MDDSSRLAPVGHHEFDSRKHDAPLGSYGDVPVAYAVFNVVLDEARERVVDLVFAHVNQIYLDWLDAKETDLLGHTFLEAIPNASTEWFEYCYRAVVLGEKVHDVIYSSEIGHWLSFNLGPCPLEGHCVFAFSLADTEQHAREELTVDLDTSDLIIALADAFSGEASYGVAMNRLLAALSRIAHARHLSLIERGKHTSGVAFEWCDEGIEPLIDVMQNMPNEEFAQWDHSAEREPLLIVADVTNSDNVDDERLDQLEARGVTSIMVVPVKSDQVTLGYLVADNYELDNDLDVLRLMQTVASFVGARMLSHRLVDELERNSMHDALTDLLNRRGIDVSIDEYMARHPGESYVLVLMDIDDFKTVNDIHGHDVGDEALRTLARTVSDAFPPDAIIGRNGGDEFLTFIGGHSHDEVRGMLEALLAQDLSFTLDGKRYQLSMSAGYVCYPGRASSLMDAYSKADKALYAVKLAGKSGCMAYSPDMERQYRSQLGFTPRDIAESIPGAIVVHRPTGDGEILFANDEAVELFECESLADFMELTGGIYAGLIHPDDAERVRCELGSQIGLDDVGQKDFVNYRIVTKRGSVRNVCDIGRLVEVEGLGKIFYELIINNDEYGNRSENRLEQASR